MTTIKRFDGLKVGDVFRFPGVTHWIYRAVSIVSRDGGLFVTVDIKIGDDSEWHPHPNIWLGRNRFETVEVLTP